MTSRTPPHPFGHGRPPSPSELARFQAIVADLTGESARTPRQNLAVPTMTQRARHLYAWLRTDESGPLPGQAGDGLR